MKCNLEEDMFGEFSHYIILSNLWILNRIMFYIYTIWYRFIRANLLKNIITQAAVSVLSVIYIESDILKKIDIEDDE